MPPNGAQKRTPHNIHVIFILRIRWPEYRQESIPSYPLISHGRILRQRWSQSSTTVIELGQYLQLRYSTQLNIRLYEFVYSTANLMSLALTRSLSHPSQRHTSRRCMLRKTLSKTPMPLLLLACKAELPEVVHCLQQRSPGHKQMVIITTQH